MAADEMPSTSIPCPFVYASGKRCTGHVARVEAYKADLIWAAERTGGWSFDFSPRSHYHVFCSEKSNHAGVLRRDSPAMKFYYDQLPEPLRRLLGDTAPPKADARLAAAAG